MEMPQTAHRLWLCAAALLLLPGAGQVRPAPHYTVTIDERDPLVARFTLALPDVSVRPLVVDRPRAASFAEPLRCGADPLPAAGVASWILLPGCRTVTWSIRLANLDEAGTDATAPASGWSRRNRLWLLAGNPPWPRLEHQPPAPADVRIALAGGGSLERRYTVTPGRGAPLVLALSAGPVRRYAARAFEIRVMGDAPRFAGADSLQHRVARTWLRWRRDLVPAGAAAVARLDFAWVQPAAGAEPGFFASANSHAVVMQYVPDPADSYPEIKLRAAVMLTGAHEAFHMLLGAVPGSRPAWINESWASYFAYAAARRHLKGESLALADGLVAAPAPVPILEANRRFEKGDQSQAGIFYGKGARFWAAIEAVLTVPANRSGRLAALIRSTGGMQGLDWRDADAVAAFLDRYSNGRAGAIVRCYLAEPDCSS